MELKTKKTPSLIFPGCPQRCNWIQLSGSCDFCTPVSIRQTLLIPRHDVGGPELYGGQ